MYETNPDQHWPAAVLGVDRSSLTLFHWSSGSIWSFPAVPTLSERNGESFNTRYLIECRNILCLHACVSVCMCLCVFVCVCVHVFVYVCVIPHIYNAQDEANQLTDGV